jgi:hypothetical protein
MVTTSSLSPELKGIPVADAVKAYPQLEPAIQKIGKEFQALAPFPDMYRKWTRAEKDNLVRVMKS